MTYFYKIENDEEIKTFFPPAGDGEPICNQQYDKDWNCARKHGHSGPHVGYFVDTSHRVPGKFRYLKPGRFGFDNTPTIWD